MGVLGLIRSVFARKKRRAKAGPVVSVQRTRVPRLEILEDRLLPANYYWSPPQNAVLNAGIAGNWTNFAGAPYLVKPGAADTLIFDGNNNANCIINFDPGNPNAPGNASAAYTAIDITAGYRGAVTLQRNVTFQPSNGMAQPVPSDISGAVRGVGVVANGQPGHAPKMSFLDGSSVSIGGGASFGSVSIVNGTGNTASVSGTSDWVSAAFVNNGTATWGDARPASKSSPTGSSPGARSASRTPSASTPGRWPS
jgi:hypothetical protein